MFVPAPADERGAGRNRIAKRRTSPSGGAPHLVGQRPIGEGFCQVNTADLVGAVEVGECAGDSKHAVIAACRKPAASRRSASPLESGLATSSSTAPETAALLC